MTENKKQLFKDLQNGKYKNNDLYDTYENALQQLKNEKKTTHWIWYIFPQIYGLGQQSKISKLCAIKDLDEAIEYLKDDTLGKRLLEASETIYNYCINNNKRIRDVLDNDIDVKKLMSSMTLFELAYYIKNGYSAKDPNTKEVNIFTKITTDLFAGKRCKNTLKIANYEDKMLKRIGTEIAIFMKAFNEKFCNEKIEETNKFLATIASSYDDNIKNCRMGNDYWDHLTNTYTISEDYISKIVEEIYGEYNFKFIKDIFGTGESMVKTLIESLNLLDEKQKRFTKKTVKQYDKFKFNIISNVLKDNKSFKWIYKDHKKLNVILSSIEKTYDEIDKRENNNRKKRPIIEEGLKEFIKKEEGFVNGGLAKDFYYRLSQNNLSEHDKNCIGNRLDGTYLGNINSYEEFEEDYKKVMENHYKSIKKKQKAFENFKKNLRKEVTLEQEQRLLPKSDDIKKEKYYLNKFFDFLTEEKLYDGKISSITMPKTKEDFEQLKQYEKEKLSYEKCYLYPFFEILKLSKLSEKKDLDSEIKKYFFEEYLPSLDKNELDEKKDIFNKNINFLLGCIDKNIPQKIIDMGYGIVDESFIKTLITDTLPLEINANLKKDNIKEKNTLKRKQNKNMRKKINMFNDIDLDLNTTISSIKNKVSSLNLS